MKLKGRIYKVLPIQSGTSQNGNSWQKQEFVFEFFEEENQRFADRVPLNVMNDRIKEYDLHEGDEVEIGFGHNVREYNGRYYADFSIYYFKKLKGVGGGSEEQPKQSTQVVTQEQTAAMDKLKAMGEQAATGKEDGSEGELPF